MPRRFRQWYFEPHALDRMRDRNISPEQVKETVLHPERLWLSGKGIRRGPKWNFKKSFSSRILQVAAEFVNDTCYIVTAFWAEK
jgi:hypothetical protein